MSCTVQCLESHVMHRAMLGKPCHAPCNAWKAMSCTVQCLESHVMHRAMLGKPCHAPCNAWKAMSCTVQCMLIRPTFSWWASVNNRLFVKCFLVGPNNRLFVKCFLVGPNNRLFVKCFLVGPNNRLFVKCFLVGPNNRLFAEYFLVGLSSTSYEVPLPCLPRSGLALINANALFMHGLWVCTHTCCCSLRRHHWICGVLSN